MEAYTDVDCVGLVNDRRSTICYCTFVRGNLVTWRSKKQPVVIRSSIEAEFRALVQGICEVLWMKNLLKELLLEHKGPTTIHCDNKATISIAHNPYQHNRTKHVEVDKHFIKEKIETKKNVTPFVSTKHQLANVFTKGFINIMFNPIIDKLGMHNIYAPT